MLKRLWKWPVSMKVEALEDDLRREGERAGPNKGLKDVCIALFK